MAKTIVMIHGMWSNAWVWDEFKSYFQKQGYLCVTPPLRYHDVNPLEPTPPELGLTSLLDYADDLERTIAFQADRPILMGHGMGGLLVQILAARGLAKMGIALAPAPPAGIWALNYKTVRVFWRHLTRWGFWRKTFRQTFEQASASTIAMLPETSRIQTFSKFVSESGRSAYEIAFWFLDTRGAARVDQSRVKCPMLFIAATQDPLTTPAVAKRIAAKYAPVSSFLAYDNRGHWLLAEPGWEEIAGYVTEWMEKAQLATASPQLEKRRNQRIPFKAPVTYSFPQKSFYYSGRMDNYCANGMQFTTVQPISPGRRIAINTLDSRSVTCEVETYQGCSAEVKWCRRLPELGNYEIGARFADASV